MRMKHPIWLPITLILIATISCASPISTQPALLNTSTPNAAGGSSGAGAGGSSGGSGSGGNSGGGAGAGGSNNVIGSPAPTTIPTPGPQGPYVVKQIQTLADETISGEVCSLINTFTVNVTTPKVAFNFGFVPASAEHGKWTYAYSIPSAGEAHDASGDYTISQASTDGTLHLSMSGSDHVVFKGFDGNFPVHYNFDLVPSQNTGCPASS